MCFVCGPAAHHETTKATKEIATVFENCNVNVNVDANACPDNALFTAVKRETEKERERAIDLQFISACSSPPSPLFVAWFCWYLFKFSVVCVVRAFVCLCVCVFVLHIHLHTSPTRTWEQHRVPKLCNRVTVTYNVREREICNGDNASRRAAVADLFTRSKRFTKKGGSHRSSLRGHFTCTCRGNNIWSSSASSRCP